MPVNVRDLYEATLDAQQLRPLYCEPWWLDAICGPENWHVYFFKDEHGSDIACIPYYKTKVSKLNAIITPPMTQWCGILHIKKSAFIDIRDLLHSLSPNPIVDLSIKSESEINFSNGNPSGILKYSFVIGTTSGIDQVRAKYSEGLRRNIKEAEKDYTLEESDDIKKLISLAHSSYEQRNEKAPAWFNELPLKVHDTLQKHNRGRIILAFKDHKPVAGIMTGWDSSTEYYLLGGRDTMNGPSVHAFLLDKAILHAISSGRKFDFEGSMHPGIANFFQSFGANPEPYIQLRKYTGPGKLWAFLHK